PMTEIQGVDLPVGGMHCASCAARIEKTLSQVPGVQDAAVNFATGTATVQYDPAQVEPRDLCAAVEDAGYTAALPREDPAAAVDEERHLRAAEYAALRRKFWVSALLSLPIFIISMAMLQFPYRNWVLLALSLPVVL